MATLVAPNDDHTPRSLAEDPDDWIEIEKYAAEASGCFSAGAGITGGFKRQLWHHYNPNAYLRPRPRFAAHVPVPWMQVQLSTWLMMFMMWKAVSSALGWGRERLTCIVLMARLQFLMAGLTDTRSSPSPSTGTGTPSCRLPNSLSSLLPAFASISPFTSLNPPAAILLFHQRHHSINIHIVSDPAYYSPSEPSISLF